MERGASSIPHVAALDGLRGLAVAAVLVFHAGHLTGGYLGVDLFFVLSGFLITSLLLAAGRSAGRIELGTFWARRARRLLPALAVMLVGVGVYCALLANPTEYAQIRGDALATIGYVANWRSVFARQDYWALFRSPSPLEHTWSLAIEEQFYLVWPLIFVGLLAWRKRRTPSAVLATSLVLAAASTVLMSLLYTTTNTSRVYYGTDTRASAVLLGAALAAATTIWGPARRRATRIAVEGVGLVGVGALAVAWVTLDGSSATLYHGGLLICSMAGVAVIAAAVQPERLVLGRVLAIKPLCWLGLISYGVYLWHWPVDVVMNHERVGLDGWPLFAVQLAVTLTIALASYRLVEMPIRRGAGTRRQWRVAVPMIAAGLVAVALVTTAGAEPAIGGGSADAAASIDAAPKALLHSQRDMLRHQRSFLDSKIPVSRPRVLVVGDSVAWTLADGASTASDAPFAVANASILGCGISRGAPLGGYYPDRAVARRCSVWPGVWSAALDIFEPRAVVLFPGAWELLDRRVGAKVLRVFTPQLERELDSRLVVAMDIARSRGARFVLLTVPCFHPSDSALGAQEAPLGDPRRARWLNRALRAFARRHPGQVTLIDFDSFGCRNGQPDPAIYRDGLHFSKEGAGQAWQWLSQRLMPVLERSG